MAKEDDQAIRDATEAAIASVRSLLNNGINPRAMVGTLSETELGLIVTSAVFAWIKSKAEAHMRYGVNAVEHAIRTMGRNPEPQQAGAAASILSKLANIDGLPWGKPVTDWNRDEMVTFVWGASQLMNAALAEMQETMPNVVRRTCDELEREANAALGGPLMTKEEIEEAF